MIIRPKPAIFVFSLQILVRALKKEHFGKPTSELKIYNKWQALSRSRFLNEIKFKL